MACICLLKQIEICPGWSRQLFESCSTKLLRPCYLLRVVFEVGVARDCSCSLLSILLVLFLHFHLNSNLIKRAYKAFMLVPLQMHLCSVRSVPVHRALALVNKNSLNMRVLTTVTHSLCSIVLTWTRDGMGVDSNLKMRPHRHTK